MDPAKMKVVELRAELANRGLDQKGVKAVLVLRLQAALDEENGVSPSPNEDSNDSGNHEVSTPARGSRRRRTRSATRSPSPVAVDEVTPMDTLVEEEYTEPAIRATEIDPDKDSDVVITSEEIVVVEPTTERKVDEDVHMEDPVAPVVSDAPIVPESPTTPCKVLSPAKQAIRAPAKSSPAKTMPVENTPGKTSPFKALPIDDSAEIGDTEIPDVPEEVTSTEVLEETTKVEDAEATTAEPEATEQMETDDAVTSDAKPIDDENVEKIDEEKQPDAEAAVSESADSKDGSTDKKDDRKRRHTRSKSPSPIKRTRRPSAEQNIDDFTNDEDEPEIDDSAVLLSWVDSDLHLKVNSSEFLSARPISDGALSLAYAGVRATHGVTKGKVAYEVQVTESNRLHSTNSSNIDKNPFDIRCGWSTKDSVLQLGEAPLSFAYGGVGKKVLNSEFSDYGRKFGARGDVIGVYLDLDSTPCQIEYTVNGESQGVAFEFERSELGDEALFPHILSRNMAFRVNFGQLDKLLVNEARPSRKDDRRDSSSRRSDRHREHRDSNSKRDRSRDEKKRDRRNSDKEKSVSADDQKPAETETPEAVVVTEVAVSDEAATAVISSEDVITEAEAKIETEPDTELIVASTEETKVEKMVEEDVEAEPVTTEAEHAIVDEATSAEVTAEIIVDSKNGDAEDLEQPASEKEQPASEKEQPASEKEQSAEPIERTLLPDYILIGKVPIEDLIAGIVRAECRKDCEVILMIGLPGAGKTFWVNKYVTENPEKQYQVLGLQSLLNKMTVNGEPRRKHTDGKWDTFVDWCMRSVNSVLDIANKRRRNYIIDQSNVVSTGQRRKMKGFGDFRRVAVVIVPSDEELKKRCDIQVEEDNKVVSENAVNEMKANFSLPSSECWFEEVKYVELEAEEAKKKVDEYNEQGKKALPPPSSHSNRNNRDYDNRRRHGGGGDFRDRERDRDRRPNWNSGGDRRGPRDQFRQAPAPHWRGGGGGGGGGFERRDRWGGGQGGYGGGSGGGGGGGGRGGDNRQWMSSQRGGGRFDERGYRGPPGGGGGGGYRRDFSGGGGGGGYDRDRREDRSGGGRGAAFRDRDFRDGNRDRHGGDKRNTDRGVPQREKDDKKVSAKVPSYQQPSSKNYSTNNAEPTQGHWNPNVVGANANNWNNYYQQQSNWNDYSQQQQQSWMSWQQTQQLPQQQQQQQQQQQSVQTPHQQWNNWHQQQGSDQQGWQNWAQYAQAYGSVDPADGQHSASATPSKK